MLARPPTSAPTDRLLERLELVRGSGTGWVARCPAHEDRHPSLSIAVGTDGRALVTCHAGCSIEAIVGALDLTVADLYPATQQADTVVAKARPALVRVTRYEICDQAGVVQAIHERRDWADRTKDFLWRRPDGRLGLGGRAETSLPLYRSQTLAGVRRDTPVFVVEGESAADALARLVTLLPVLGTVTGAGSTPGEDALAVLRGRPVFLWPDNDEVGHAHMARIAEALLPIAAAVRILHVPGLPPKGDAADFVAAGRSVEELLEVARLSTVASKQPSSATTTLAAALDLAVSFLCRYVAFPRIEAAVACALWAAHTHAIEYADATAYLGVTSPDKGSGKTRLLEATRLLTRSRPGILIIPTASTIYRMLEADPSGALILDELDAVFRDRTDRYEEVRAVINAGHRRGATVPRNVPGPKQKWVVRQFPVFGPRILAGIGRLPDTVADRSIPIRMQKRKPTERVERFRAVEAERGADPIYQALADAIAAHPPSREAAVPTELPDRAADGWEPLLALADVAGGGWPARARRAAVVLQGDHEDEESVGLRLLADCRVALGDADRMATAALLAALKSDEESLWVDEHHPLTPERLARLLRPFGVRSRELKIGGVNVRGYLGESFVDPWSRYLAAAATPSQGLLPRYSERAGGSTVAGSQEGSGLGDHGDRGETRASWQEYGPSAYLDDDAEDHSS